MTEVIEATAIVPMESGAIMQLQKAEIEAQIDVARKYPRSIKQFEEQATTMACYDQQTSESMFYTLKRRGNDGKTTLIQGPSTRLAEVIAATWGNIRAGARVVETGQSFVVAQGFCMDMQTNTGTTVEVQRRITNKEGKRYSDDMVQVTAAAACSIAFRNAVLRVVPRMYADKILGKAKEMAMGKGVPIVTRQQNAAKAFEQMGLNESRVCAVVGKSSYKDLTIDDLTTLKGLQNAIRDGAHSIEEAFPEAEEPEKPSGLKAELAAARAAKREPQQKCCFTPCGKSFTGPGVKCAIGVACSQECADQADREAEGKG